MVMFHIVHSEAQECDSGWTYHNGYCYILRTNQDTYSNHEASCAASGGHLTSILNQDENDFVHSLGSEGMHIWLGASPCPNINSNDDFIAHCVWNDGNAVSGYQNWNANEPNNHSEMCIEMYVANESKDKKWNDPDCNNLNEAVCKKRGIPAWIDGVDEWTSKFDNQGWSTVPVGGLIAGFERSGSRENGNNGISHIEFAYYVMSLWPDVCTHEDWTHTWDHNHRWVTCPPGSAINGLYRSHPGQGDRLSHIEEGKCCKGVTDECKEVNVDAQLDRLGLAICPVGYAIRGMYKSSCDALHCLDKFECCKVIEHMPTPAPTPSPSSVPSVESTTQAPTKLPTTEDPTKQPSLFPTTEFPTKLPTRDPATSLPTQLPSTDPSISRPTEMPTDIPTTENPTKQPSLLPTTEDPTKLPTKYPITSLPTQLPTNVPSTSRPTKVPTNIPTTDSPTKLPSNEPSISRPTNFPITEHPTKQPSLAPTTADPTNFVATELPTKQSSLFPTRTAYTPSLFPTTKNSTKSPTRDPFTSPPTQQPSNVISIVTKVVKEERSYWWSDLHWWLLIIIITAVMLALFITCVVAYLFYKKFKLEKEEKAIVMEELKYEQDGIGGFFENANITESKIKENPLHMKRSADLTIQTHPYEAQMILSNDVEFNENVFAKRNPEMFAPKQIARDEVIEIDELTESLIFGGESLHDLDRFSTIANESTLSLGGGSAMTPSDGLYHRDSEILRMNWNNDMDFTNEGIETTSIVP